MTSDASCPVNLGPREARRRLVPGLVMVALASVGSILAVSLGWGLLPRLALVIPLGLGALNLLQARAKT